MAVATTMRVVLEVGKTWAFATAIDWPGWCRRGKGEHAALDALLDYADRYALVAGDQFIAGEPRVLDRVAGNATTDFGAPGVPSPLDDEPVDAAGADRLAGLLAACWSYFDDVVAGAPEQLRKGPRGGGRDRDPIVDQVREAERNYARMVGARVPPRTPWAEQRAAVLAALHGDVAGTSWSVRYFLRRTAWHVLDHAWEIEDKGST